MKRVISALLSVLLLGCLTACSRDDGQSKNGDSRSGTLKVAIGETNTDFDGVSVRILNLAEDEGKTQLNVRWVNETSYEVVYGESYDIEREQNGKWSSCAINGLNFTAIGYELRKNATQTKSYTLSNSFDISENGKYRFVTDCSVYDKGRGGESTKCKLWAEFTVTRTGDSGGEVQKSFIDFKPQYIRTDGYREDADYPVVKIIRSVDGLKAYYNASKDKYDLERKDKVYSDTTIGFLDACDKYNEAYFEKQILVMVLLEEVSGSNRHNVDNVKLGSDGKLYISIRSIIPEAGTCDMAAWHILIEPEADIDVASESDVIVYLDGVNPKTQPTTARESGNYSNIELTIPHDWNYEMEHGDNANEYCISFWPADQDEGKIKVWCYTAFGVCGTGLEEKEITVGAYKARKGTYDNKKVWDFISFTDMPGSYVAINEGADKWWDRYGDEAMKILGTVKIADGIIDKSQAIEIAKKGFTAKFDRTDAIFDSEKGLWTVSFYEKNRSEKVQSITVSYNGKVINKEVAK